MDAGDLTALRGELRAAAQPADAPAMAAYMKHRFQFLGVKTPARRAASKPFIDAHKAAPGDELIATARLLWRQPEREFHYVATDLLSRWQRNLGAEHLVGVHELITTNSWWDTVDALAAHVVGGLVRRNHGLTTTMDAWIDDPDIWLARSAILHQLAYRSDTDAHRQVLSGLTVREALKHISRSALAAP